MKKIISLIITATLILTSVSISFAKANNAGNQNGQQTTKGQNQNIKAKKQTFKINGSPVIKYGRYKLPISPVTKGVGATLAFDKATAVLTVTKGTNTIVIDFKANTVTVNGTAVTNSGIFTAKNDKKMTVLIKYIANVLGVRADVDKEKVVVEVPGLDLPTNVTVTPAGAAVAANTLNTATLYMEATAKIIAGQATGGKAELYVGSKLVATDAAIAAADTSVTFTTSDGTPDNAELQAAIPAGGIVTVKLYNAANQSVTSAAANPTLIVDYIAPTITGINSAVYNAAAGQLIIVVTGAGAIGDLVDVTKVSLYDSTLAKTYQLTNTSGTGSNGAVSSADSLTVNVGSADKLGLTGFGTTTVFLTVPVCSLLTDAAGNASASFTAIQNVPVTVVQ